MYSHHGTLVADQVTAVTIGADIDVVEIVNVDGVDAIYFTLDDSITPAVAGDGTLVLPAAPGSLVLSSSSSAPTVVKLISHGTPSFSVIDVSDPNTYDRFM